MNTTFGIIDIGSNTIRMNIYQIEDQAYSLIMSTKSAAGLVSYVRKDHLNDDGIRKLIDVLNEFKEVLRVLHVQDYAAFATASLRNITNTAQVLEQVHSQCGIDVEILSGPQEGRLSFQGAIHALKKEEGLYIDTGGGSTELVLYDVKTIRFVSSMPIGSLNLYNKYVQDILPDHHEARKIMERVHKELKAVAPERAFLQAETLAVTGGSMRGVRDVLVALKWLRPDQYEFSPSVLQDLKQELLEDPSKAVRLFLKVAPDRIQTLLPGLLIVLETARYTGAQTIQISTSGIREGYLAEKIMHKDEF